MRAAEIGAETFQIFSASPRMWRAGTPDPVQIQRLQSIRERHAIGPLVIHVNYLINLASGDPEIHAKSAPLCVSPREDAEWRCHAPGPVQPR